MSIQLNQYIYVPVFLEICAISKLRCAFCQLLNCVPISKLRTLLRNLETKHNEALNFSFVCINCCVSCYIICTLCNVVVISFYYKTRRVYYE